MSKDYHNIHINIDKTIKVLDNIANMDLTNAMELVGIEVENNIRSNPDMPIDTGELRRSITHQIIDDHTVEVGTNLFYAPFQNYGTGIYAFNGDGRKDVPWHYKDVKGEWHTTYGIHPNLFMEKGLEASEETIKAIINNEIRRQIKNA